MVAAIGAVAGVAGAAMSSSAAGDAADAQAGASREASMAQQMAQAQMRQDLSPWVESGRGANSLLNRYLGIGGVGSGRVTSAGLQTGLSPDQVRQQLMSRYTTTGMPANAPSFNAEGLPLMERIQYDRLRQMGDANAIAQFEASHLGAPTSVRDFSGANTGTQGDVNAWQSVSPTSTVDEAGLNAAVQQYYAEQDALNREAEADPTYGSLLRAYRNGAEFDSGPAFERGADFSFTGKDLATEPGYQFGLQQGTQGIERGQAARGNFLSGAAMKELTRFNEDYAGTKFNEGFNRAYNTYNTNLTGRLNEYNTNLTRRQNEWNTNLSAYNDNRNRIFNFLNGVSTLGQNSAAQTGAAALQVGNNVSNNLLSAGNAQAASSIASGNAWQSGLNSAANSLRQPATGINSPSGWNMLLANQSSDPIGSLNSQMGWTG